LVKKTLLTKSGNKSARVRKVAGPIRAIRPTQTFGIIISHLLISNKVELTEYDLPLAEIYDAALCEQARRKE
jgi:hypothetical protein